MASATGSIRDLEPLVPVAAARCLALLLDVDTLCRAPKAVRESMLTRTHNVLAAADVQVVLVSTRAYDYALSLRSELDSAWWCDRTLGWENGHVPVPPTRLSSYALVLAQLRQRLADVRVICISNDPSLHAALDARDCSVSLVPMEDALTPQIELHPHELADAIWYAIDLRMHRRRSGRR